MIGILNIYKPKGVTSSDVVVTVRKILGTKAVGHFGTLDPLGEGVLPIGVGKATRLFEIMLKKDKTYEAEFRFGFSTDTLDSDGVTVCDGGYIPTLNEIKSILPEFTGKQFQEPPIYSAKNVNGKRAYDLARCGNDFSLPKCEIEIFDVDVFSTENTDTFKVNLHCSSGTYVRSFGRDLAKRLGTFATMISIKRLKCGPYDIESSISLDKLSEIKEQALMPVESALQNIPRVCIDDGFYDYLVNGIKPESRGVDCELFALYCRGELFGIAKNTEDGRIKIINYLREDKA